MKTLLMLLAVTILLTSCSGIHSETSTIQEPTGTWTVVPSPVPPTPTLIPTSTATAKPTNTPTIIMTPTPTPIPPPEGITEMGYYFWSLSNDLGLEIETKTYEEFHLAKEWPVWLFSENNGQKLYNFYFSGGYEVNEKADTFLLISIYQRYGANIREWDHIGLGFSIFHGYLHEKCQGKYIGGGGWTTYIDQCYWERYYPEDPFNEVYRKYITDQLQMHWFPFIAYPIGPEQVKILEEKYSLRDFPRQHSLFGTYGRAE